MSATIDERVVEMRFDNKQFKAGVKETMSVLDRLKLALNLPGATKGFEQVDKAVKNVKLDGLQAGIDVLTKRFSTMGIVADQVVRNITNSVTGKLMKAVSFVKEGIVSGGIRRAMNIENAHFQLQALLKDETKVQEIMDNAMTSVDGTAYAYDEAAKAASMFAASGVQGGEQMVNALMGVVGAAAMTNSEYEGIANIFTTVAGQGRLMADQLNQFASRGLNAAATIADYFNEVNAGGGKATESVRTAIKTMTKGMKTTEADIRSMVSDGQISFDIFSQAMNNAFGESAKKANETFTGAFANMKSALSRIGAGFISPLVEQNGQLVKMFNAARERINDIKKALVFDESIGNVNALSKQFTDAVKRISKSVTDFLVHADLTKPMELFYYGVEIVKNSAKGLRTVLAPLTQAFKNVFLGFSIDDVIKIADWLETVTSKMKLSYKASSNLYDAFKGIFNVGKLVVDIFIGLLKALLPVNKPIFELGDGILEIAGGFGRMLTKFTEWLRSSGKLEKAFSKISSGVKGVSKFLSEMISGFGDFTKKVKDMPAVEKLLIAFTDAWNFLKESVLSGIEDLGISFDALHDFVANSIPESATDVYDFLADKIEKVANALVNLMGIARKNEGFDAFITNMVEFFKKTKEQVGDGSIETRIEGIKKAFEGFVDFLKQWVAPALSSINLGSIISLLTGFATMKSVGKLTKSLTSLKAVAASIGKNFASTLGKLGKTLEAYQQNLKADSIKKIAAALLLLAGALVILSFCDTDRLMGAATALSLVAGTVVLAMEKFQNANNDAKAMNTLANGIKKGIKNLTSAVKWKAIGSTVKDFAKSVAIIAGSIIALGLMYKHDKEAMEAGVDLVMDIAKILVSVTAGIAIVSKVLGKDGTKGMKQVGSSILLISASLLVITTALKSLFKMELPEDWQLKVELLAGIFGGIISLILAVGLASKVAGDAKINGGPIITAAVAMILVVQSLKTLFKMELPSDWGIKVGILAGIFGALGTLILVIGAASKLAGGKLKGTGTILAMCVFIGTAVAALMVLSIMPGEKLLKGATALGVILMALAVALAGAGKITKGESYKSVLAMAITVGAITASLAALSMMDEEGLKKACLALGSMLLALAVDFAAIGKITDEGAWKSVAAMVAETVAITIALAVLAEKDWQGLLAAAGSLSAVLLSLSASFAIIGQSKADNKKIASFLLSTTSLLPIVAALAILSEKDWKGMLAAGTALSEVILAFSGAFVLIGLAKPDMKAIATFLLATLAIIPIAVALYELSEQPWEGLLSAATALSEVLLAMSAAMAVAALVGSAGGAAIAGIGILDLFIADLALVLVALGALTKIEGFSEIIQNGGEVLASIGNALGAFVGNIIGGALGGISSGFVEIGKNLSRFSEEAQPFFDHMQNIDSSVFSGIAALAEAILLLTAKGLLDGISSLFGSKYTLSDLGEELKNFADPLKEYAKKVKGIDASAVEGSANAIKILADAANSLGRTGGKWQEFFGEKRTLADFGEELAKFGPALKQYAITTLGINEKHVEGSANAITVLVEAADKLGNTGGLLQGLLGEKKTLSDFAVELRDFAPALLTYVAYTHGITEKHVQGSANAMQILIEASNSLERTGGVAGMFGGNKDLADFGKKLVSFGTALADYYNATFGIESYKMTGVITATQKLIDMAASAKGIDFSSLGSFSSNLQKMGEAGINEFLNAFQNAEDRAKAVVNNLVDVVVDTFRGRSDEFKSVSNALMTNFIIGAEGTKRDVQTVSDRLIDSSLRAMRKREDDAKNQGASFANSLADGLQSKKKEVSGKADGIITNALSSLAKKNKDFTKQGKDSMNAFVDGVRSTSKGGFSKVESDMKSVGENIVGGLKSGLDAALPSLLSKAKNIASQIDATTRATLEIHSPSLVAYETAKYYTLGLVKGLNDTGVGVRSAAFDLASIISKTVNKSLKQSTFGTAELQGNSNNNFLSKFVKKIAEEVKLAFDIMQSSDIIERVENIAKRYEYFSSKAENTSSMLEREIEKWEKRVESAEEKEEAARAKKEKAEETVEKKKEELAKAEATLKKKKATVEEKQAVQKEKEADLAKKKTDAKQKAVATAKKNVEKAEKEVNDAQKTVDKAQKEVEKARKSLKKEQASYKDDLENYQNEVSNLNSALNDKMMQQNRQYMEYTYENKKVKEEILVQEDVYWKKLLATKQKGNESAKYLDMTLLQFEEEVLQKTIDKLRSYTQELESTRDNLMDTFSLFSEIDIGGVKASQQELSKAEENLISKRAELQEKQVNLNEKEIALGKEQTETALKEVEDAKNSLAEVLKEIEQAEQAVEEARKKVDKRGSADKYELINNLQDQVTAMQEFSTYMMYLGERLKDTRLGEYIQTLGVDALPQLKAIGDMTDKELDYYVSLYDTKFAEANLYAEKHLKDLKETTEKEIAEVFNVDADVIDINKLTEVFDGTIGSISKYLEETTGKHKYNMKQYTISSAIGMVEATEEVKPQVEQAGKDIGKTHTDGIEEAMKDNKLMARSIGKYLDKVDDKQPQAYNSGEQIGAKTTAGAKSNESGMVRAGISIGQGYINGILSKMAEAAAAGAALAEATKNATTSSMEIKSPSRVMKKIGGYVGEGFVNGIISFLTEAKKSGERMGTEALNGLYDSFGGANSTFDPNVGVTIKPVIDLTNAIDSAKEISKLFNEAVNVSASIATGAMSSASIAKAQQEVISKQRKSENLEEPKGNTYEFVQNNYSPKALSRIEIYRQTKNQFRQYREAVESK